MKIALTGASGRIGNVLVRRLLADGHELRVLSRRESKALAGLPIGQVKGDLSDAAALSELAAGVEVLFHLAAVVSVQGGMQGKVRQANVEGTRKVLEASLQCGVRRVVCFSSVHAFQEGQPEELLDETRPLALHSRTAYSQTKAEALDLAFRFSAEKKLEVLALCPTSVIGPFDYEPSLSGQMLIDFYRQKIPMLVAGGFDWVDVRDVAEAAVAAMDKGHSGEAYLLSSQYATMSEMAQRIGRATGKRTPKYLAPDGLLRLGVPFVVAFARLTGTRPLYTGEALDALRYGSKRVSSEKAKRELGYSPRSLETTLADSFTWFREHHYL